MVVLSAALAGCNSSDKSQPITPKVVKDKETGDSPLRNMVTDSGTVVSAADSVDSPEAEAVANLIDGNAGSKFLSFSDSVTVELTAAKEYAIKSYSLVSGNDAPERDPSTWTLAGSVDGTTWVDIDSQAGQTFSDRGLKRTFDLADNEAMYTYYRFSFSNAPETAAGIFQLAEIELTVIADAPLVAFESNKKRAEVNEAVQFWDSSLANPTSWMWTFEDGVPATSTAKNPSVKFSSLGTKKVTLVATNDKGSNELTQEAIVHVWDSKKPWASYKKPQVSFVAVDKEHEGQVAFERVMPDIEEVIHDISLAIAKILYKDASEAPLFKTVTFETGNYDFPAAKGGTDQDMELFMDLKHLANKAAEGDESLRNEVIGMLWHELTHGYNNSPNSGQYAAGDEYHSYLEGLADFMRIKQGFNEHKRGDIKWVEDWNVDAYNQTSFFLEWVVNNHRNTDFIYLFNKAAGDLEVWNFDTAFKSIFGDDRGVAVLWAEYQKDMNLVAPYPTAVEGYRNVAIDEGVTVTSSATDLTIWNEGVLQLVDNNVEKKFNAFIEDTWWRVKYAKDLVIQDVSNVVLTFTLPEELTIQKYSLSTSNDNPHRDPSSWTLSGSADGETWIELDADSYPESPARLTTFHFDIDNATTAYKHYQFVIENAQTSDNIGGDNGRLIQLGEIALLTAQ